MKSTLNGKPIGERWQDWPKAFAAESNGSANRPKPAEKMERDALRPGVVTKDSTRKVIITIGPGAGWQDIQKALRIH